MHRVREEYYDQVGQLWREVKLGEQGGSEG